MVTHGASEKNKYLESKITDDGCNTKDTLSIINLTKYVILEQDKYVYIFKNIDIQIGKIF